MPVPVLVLVLVSSSAMLFGGGFVAFEPSRRPRVFPFQGNLVQPAWIS